MAALVYFQLIANKQEVICVKCEKPMFVWSNLANTINFM